MQRTQHFQCITAAENHGCWRRCLFFWMFYCI